MTRPNALFALLGLIALSSAHAADVEDALKDRAAARHDAVVDQAEANYDAAKKQCKTLKGNVEDICLKDAKAAYTREKSQAQADEKAAKAQAGATAEQLEAGYKAAKERCDALSGSAKDACISKAKVNYHQ